MSSYFSDDTQFWVVRRGSFSTWVSQTWRYRSVLKSPRCSLVMSALSTTTDSRSQGLEMASTKKRSFLSGGSSFSIICEARVSMDEMTRDKRSRNCSPGACHRRSVGQTPSRCSRSRAANLALPLSQCAKSTMLVATKGLVTDSWRSPKTRASSKVSASFMTNPPSASCWTNRSNLSCSMGLLLSRPASRRKSLIVIMQIGESTS
mmetsp:Transcript_62132/g.172198  ORF Transcript_62132/g.172198 Transcript_62132/m.172198 type:complete len:205 (+) Transcript_62132:472-1086(+)